MQLQHGIVVRLKPKEGGSGSEVLIVALRPPNPLLAMGLLPVIPVWLFLSRKGVK